MKVICTAVLCQTEKFNFAIDLNNQNATGFQYDHGWSVCTVLGFLRKNCELINTKLTKAMRL